MSALFTQPLKVLNVGIPSFAEAITAEGAAAVHVDWRPPASGDIAAGQMLARMMNDPDIEQANQAAFASLLKAQPVLEDVRLARDVIPLLAGRVLLHAGPPISWEHMCGPMRGAIIGAILFEQWTANAEDAARLAESGEVAFAPCHHHAAVGPMAGVISPSMPLWVIGNSAGKNRAYSSLNEGLGKVLRFGAYNAEVLKRLRWMSVTLGPTLADALKVTGGIELKPLMAQALHMGDELHNRNVAASSLLLRRLLPGLLESSRTSTEVAEVARFIAGNDHFFLNVSMAACKLMLDSAHGVPNSTLVTAMARNGVEFGIRISGTGDAWFTAPAPVVNGLFFAGYSDKDAAPDLGDSAITETAGLGGVAMAAAPAIVQFVGGTSADAAQYTERMRRITVGANPAFTIPAQNFAGAPGGIDIRKVVDRGIDPVIDTGIAHREAGVGQIGAGVSHAPVACFVKAIEALGRTLPRRPAS
jgi:hypothetical protein